MERREFGSTGKTVAVVGQGTWKLDRLDRTAAIALVRQGIDAGADHIDTAEGYGDGRVEELLGLALEGHRERVFLVSKVSPGHADRKGTVAACEASLRRLRTDRLDCYLLHWPSNHPMEETLAAFEALQESGKIRAWGVSNFSRGELEQVIAATGPRRVACNQILYHLDERGSEHEVIPYCREQTVAVVAYSPLGSGSFPSAKSARGRTLRQVANRYGVTPYQLALAFLTRLPHVFAIPQTTDATHVRDNASASEIRLEDDDARMLEESFALGSPRSGVPTI